MFALYHRIIGALDLQEAQIQLEVVDVDADVDEVQQDLRDDSFGNLIRAVEHEIQNPANK